MKHSIITFFSKPKIIVPIFGIIIIAGGFFIYRSLSKIPDVAGIVTQPTPVPRIITQNADNNTVDLSFAKTGRVELVNVKEGNLVRAGQVLVQLSAPDALGAISQTKGALDLAQARYASLTSQYETTKNQQDLIVKNTYHTLLSSGLEGIPDNQNDNKPIITGTYTCDKEGSYTLKAYASGDHDSGYTMRYSGLESGSFPVKYDAAVPMGSCGLQVKFSRDKSFDATTLWTIAIPNTKSSTYLTNKNAYDLAVTTREKTLSDLATNLGKNASGNGVAQAEIEAARGAYQAALGAYQNNIITAPVNGTISFVDKDLKVGQTVIPNKTIISIRMPAQEATR